VIALEVSDAEAQRRLEHRLVHPPSGRIYNETSIPPRIPFTDDVTGEPLVRRADDVEEKLRRSEDDEWGSLARRLAVWREEAGAVLKYYRDKGQLAMVQAEAPPEEVMRRVEAVLEGTGKGKEGKK
jgi:adenylate kinase